jgi:prolyl oligopeptidase
VPPEHVGYPDAMRLNLVEHHHGQHIPDPYRWLEDAADPRSVRWLAQQEALFSAHQLRWPDRERWQADLAALLTTDRVLTPKARGTKIFVRRHDAGQDHPTLFVREGTTERSLLDPLAIDPAGRTVVDAWEPSAEGGMLAYQLSRDGTEDSLLWVLDVASGLVVDGPIDRVRKTSIGWLPGGELFYYIRRLPPELNPGEERYHRRIYLHRIGSDPRDDSLVFGEGREKTQFYTVAVTADGRWLSVSATTGTDRITDLYLADLARSPAEKPELRPVQEAVAAHTSMHIAPGTGPADLIWLSTDWEAPRGRVVACRPADPAGAWREVITERPDAVLADLAILAGPELGRPLGLISWTRHAVAELTLHDLADGRQLGSVPLPGAGSVSPISVRPDGGQVAWFLYADHATVPILLEFDARTGQVRACGQAGSAPLGPGVTACQTEFSSRDGTRIRMFVVSPAGRPDRPRPVILTGYGGFGLSMVPAFSADAVAWARAGGVYAAACLRGGGEEGAQWHHGGRRENKQNVFDDFDAAADYLTDAGWAGPGQLGILGASNGGLLVGAALTQHPEKYAAAVCIAPLLDMARYELSGLGLAWVPEYGSADDPAQLSNLLSYSPYHHLAPGTAYPPVLFVVADGDTRVDPLHARKMCAALQHASSGTGPVLLRTDRGVGHGTRAVSSEVAVRADCLAFLADHLGLTRAAGAP